MKHLLGRYDGIDIDFVDVDEDSVTIALPDNRRIVIQANMEWNYVHPNGHRVDLEIKEVSA